MAKTSFIEFKAVKAAVKMDQVLQHYGLLDQFKKSGDSLSGPCPIHEGGNPTQFRVSLSKNVWNCFGRCKRGGNTLDFISQMESVSIHAAAVKAIEWFKLDLGSSCESTSENQKAPTRKPGTESSSTVASKVKSSDSKPIINEPLKFHLEKLDVDHPYLADRRLNSNTIADFGIGYCSKGIMENRIAIPIRNLDGKIVAYAGRRIDDSNEDVPKYKVPNGFHKGLELFNVDQAIKEPREDPLVIVEGFFDCILLYQNGWKKSIALMGSSLSTAQEALIRRITDQNSLVILMLDGDDAGQAAINDIALRLGRFAFVRIHCFANKEEQPEHLSAEALSAIVSGN